MRAARPRLRQPRRRRRRHRGRPPPARERGRERRPVLGPARRRRQLRHRHLVRAGAPPGRPGGLRRPALPAGRRGGRPAPLLPRLGAGRARRVTTAISLAAAPPLPVIPEEWHGKKVAIVIAVCAGPVEDGEALVPRAPHGRGAGRRPDPPDAVPLHPVAARPALAEGDQRLLQGGEPRPALGRDDRLAHERCTRTRRGRSARSTSTRWAARSPASGRATRPSRSARCRSSSTPSPARPEAALLGAHTEWARAVIASREGRRNRPRLRELPRRRRARRSPRTARRPTAASSR